MTKQKLIDKIKAMKKQAETRLENFVEDREVILSDITRED